MPKPSNHKKCQLLVNHFCGHAPKIFWGKEIKIAKQLLAVNSDIKFWLSVQTQDPVFSLSYFLTDDGVSLLQNLERRKNLNLKPSEGGAILSDKIGEDKEVKKKIKTTMDFLKDGEN